MGKKSNQTRNQLLMAVSFFALTGVIIASISMFFVSKIHDIYNLSNSMHGLYTSFNKAISSELSFLNIETTKKGYFETGKSYHKEELLLQVSNIHRSLDVIRDEPSFEDFHMEYEVDNLTKELKEYESLFMITSEKVKEKGFQNLGMQGKLNNIMRNLEAKSKGVCLENILALKGLEKDFILTDDPIYARKVEVKIQNIKDKVWANSKIKFEIKDSLDYLLNNYHQTFKEYETLTNEIGYKNARGLSDLLTNSKNAIDEQFYNIQKLAEVKAAFLVNNFKRGFLFVVVNIVGIFLFVVIIFTGKSQVRQEKTTIVIANPPAPVAVKKAPRRVAPPIIVKPRMPKKALVQG